MSSAEGLRCDDCKDLTLQILELERCCIQEVQVKGQGSFCMSEFNEELKY